MKGEEKKRAGKKKWHQKWWGIGFLIICSLFIVFAASFIYIVVFYVEANMQQNLQQSLVQKQLQQQDSVSTRLLIESKDDPFWGAENAPIVIVEFADFQCPFCAQAYPIIKSLRQQYAEQVKFIYRDMPDLSKHELALDAALAANCAYEQDMFWPYHDQLYDNQTSLSVEKFKRIAGNLGLNQEQFNQCFNERKYEAEIKNDLSEGINFGVTSTPTFYINGNKVPGVIPYQTLVQILEKVKQMDFNM